MTYAGVMGVLSALALSLLPSLSNLIDDTSVADEYRRLRFDPEEATEDIIRRFKEATGG